MKSTLFAFVLLLSSTLSCLDIKWVFPPTNLPGAAAGNVTPDITFNIDQIGVAVWESSVSSDIIKSAICLDGVWSALPDVPHPGTTDVERPLVGIDDAGQAICIWRDLSASPGFIETARLNGLVWTFVQTLESPDGDFHNLAVSRGGNAIAAWDDFFVAPFDTEARVYDKSVGPNGTWGATTSILAPSTITAIYSVSMNASGLGMLSFFNTDDSTVRASFFNGLVWTPATIISAGASFFPDVVINDNGNALVIYPFLDNLMSSTFSLATGLWTPLPDVIGAATVSGKVGFFNDGTGVAVWLDLTDTSIKASRFDGTRWIPFATPLTTAPTIPPTLAANREGQAVAVWTEGGRVVAAAYDANMWNPPIALSTQTASIIVGSMNAKGDVVIGWINPNPGTKLAEGPGYNAIKGSFVPPSPPTNLCLCVQENRFLTQRFFLSRLCWCPSSTSDVTCYRIFRNGHCVGEVPANCPLCFDDPSPCPRNFYQVAAVSSRGVESSKTSLCQ